MTYGTIRHEVRIRRSADDVWARVRDAANLHTWFPGLTGCTVEGTKRTIFLGSGMAMPEDILVNDDVQRRFQYQLALPIIKHHRGTIDVIALGDQECLVVYSTEADPRTMALTIGGGTAGALDELQRQMEQETR